MAFLAGDEALYVFALAVVSVFMACFNCSVLLVIVRFLLMCGHVRQLAAKHHFVAVWSVWLELSAHRLQISR